MKYTVGITILTVIGLVILFWAIQKELCETKV